MDDPREDTQAPEKHPDDMRTPPERPDRTDGERLERTEDVTPGELQGQQGEELPDREAMSLIDTNIAVPVNAAVALNVLSDDSIAYANAEQDVDIDQSS